MLVEFVGLPGSGKTSTACRLTADGSLAQRVGLRRLGPQDVVRHPFKVATQFARWSDLRTEWSDKAALTSILRRRISQDLLVAKPPLVLLLEEGITHYIWRKLFLVPGLHAEPWRPLLQVEYPLIAFETDRETLRSRIVAKETRGKINDRLAALVADSTEWDRAECLYEQTLAEASLYRPLVRVDATGDLASTVRQVRQAIGTYERQ